MREIQVQQARLHKLETEWKLKEASMLSEMKQKEVEMHLKLEQERAKLQQLQAEKEIEIAAARMRVYENFENLENQESMMKLTLFAKELNL